MKRHTYQTEMINWCEDLKEQVQKRGQYNHFEAQFKKFLISLRMNKRQKKNGTGRPPHYTEI